MCLQVVEQQEFADLVLEDARQVTAREETDSIDIIDEVRFYVANVVNTVSDLQDAEEKLRLIDQLLEDLEIDGWMTGHCDIWFFLLAFCLSWNMMGVHVMMSVL